MHFKNVYLIGLGGVGSNLARPLFHYLASLPSPPSLTLVDGDVVEPSNLSRQMYGTSDVSVPKARAIFNQLAAIKVNPDFNLYHLPKYLTTSLAQKGIPDGSLVISAVDNHKTNKLIQEHCATLSNVVYLCATSHLTHGSILTYAKRAGEELLPAITLFHPEIAEPEDRHPDEPSCMATASEGSPQLIGTNALAAITLLSLTCAVIEGRPIAAETAFNLTNFRMAPVGPLVALRDTPVMAAA